jgi:hypothetical protein
MDETVRVFRKRGFLTLSAVFFGYGAYSFIWDAFRVDGRYSLLGDLVGAMFWLIALGWSVHELFWPVVLLRKDTITVDLTLRRWSLAWDNIEEATVVRRGFGRFLELTPRYRPSTTILGLFPQRAWLVPLRGMRTPEEEVLKHVRSKSETHDFPLTQR